MANRKKMIKYLFFLFMGSMFFLNLSGCVTTASSSRSTQLTSETAPLPDQQMDREYRFQSGDLIKVKLPYHPDFNESTIIRPDGKVSLQLIDEVQAEGLTPGEFDEMITKKYAQILREPEITVMVGGFAGQMIFVGGEVNSPMVLPLKGRITVLQAIFNAGGFKDTAQPKSVIVISKDLKNRPVTRKLDLTMVISGEKPQEDILLSPQDIVYVPKSFIARADLFVDQYLKKLMPADLYMGFGF